MSNPSHTSRLLAAILLVAMTAVWGWTFVVVKEAVSAYGVVAFLAIRFVIGTLAIGAFSLPTLNRRSLATGVPIGLVLALAYLLQTYGVRATTATNCGLITGLFVVFAPVANRLLYGVRTRRVFWAAIGLSLVGLALLTGLRPASLRFGDLLTLGAAACYGLQIAMLDRCSRGHSARALAFAQVAVATLAFLAIWPAVDPISWPPASVWFALVVTGLVATGAGFFVQTFAQQRLPATQAALVIATEPAFAAFFGYLLAGDRLGTVQLAGAVLMAASVVLASMLSPTGGDPVPPAGSCD